MVSLFCIVYLCQRNFFLIYLYKEVFDNFYGSFADRDRVEEEKLGKKGAEEWLEDTI